MSNEPMGCLGFLFELFGFGDDSGDGSRERELLPYRRRDDFLSAAELKFFHVLKGVVGQHFHVCAKVRISDLLYVVNRNKNMGHANRIDRKHVDFVLCDPQGMQPKLVIELDDSSHQRADRKKRDELVDAAFAAAEVPILHVTCRSQYQTEDLKQQIRTALKLGTAIEEGPTIEAPIVEADVLDTADTPSPPPVCPKCDVPMVQRKASRGKHRGKRFWACPSYPDCKNIIAID